MEGYEVRVKGNPDYTFVTRLLINSAGLHSDRVAELAGIDAKTANYRTRMTKGEFYSVGGHKDRHINHLIYPVPMQGGPAFTFVSTPNTDCASAHYLPQWRKSTMG